MQPQVTITRAVHQYHDELVSLGRSQNTIHTYMIYLLRFARSCEGASVTAIDPPKITAFFMTIRTAPSRNMATYALRGFLAWCVKMRYLSPSSAAVALDGRKPKAVQRQPKHYIPVDQFPALLDAAGDTHPVERAAVAVALFTLCRQSEIAGITLADIDLAARELRVYRRKTRETSTVIISPDLYHELIRWLSWYAHHTDCAGLHDMMTHHGDWYLIPHFVYANGRSERDGRWTDGIAVITPGQPPTLLHFVVKRALTNLGVRSRNGASVEHLGEGMHTIRRSGARALLDHLEGPEGQDRALNMVSKMLGHSEPRTTLSYIDLDIDKRRLDDFLRSNSMYGSLPGQGQDASVIIMRSRQAREA